MREDLLHYIWKFGKLRTTGLVSTSNQKIVILNPGKHNLLSGPDFFNARLEIDNQEWAGNVEVHLKASDWYAHRHEEDDNYNNIILHVVWTSDVAVFRKDRTEIPCLELCNFVPKTLLAAYQDLLNSDFSSFINCERNLPSVDKFLVSHWLERLYFERLEERSIDLEKLLRSIGNDWERLLFMLLLKNFGLKINGASFYSLAQALDYTIVQRTRANPTQLESVLFGMTGLLDTTDVKDIYFLRLKKEYAYLKRKFNLNASGVAPPEFFKLRPSNFPTIRLSQFASLYRKQNLFSTIIKASSRKKYEEIFDVSASKYWDQHYSFGRESPGRKKKISPKFIDLILINTIIPLKFCYGRQRGEPVHEEIISLMAGLKSEENNIISNFRKLGISARNAMQSQAILQLYSSYCSINKCLQCVIGTQLLNGK
ncbi:MAG: DUF2851 family protein [Flavobacteriaceae bacterium]